MSFVLTGLDQREKADWAEAALFARLGGKDRFDEVDVRFVEAPSDAEPQEAASGRLHVTVKSTDERLVGRAFSSAVVELALANYPGFFSSSAPGEAQAFGVYWPALVPNDEVTQVVVHADGSRTTIPTPQVTGDAVELVVHPAPTVPPAGPSTGEALGRYFAARSGDKGGNANVGIFARDEAGYAWLHQHLTADAVRTLIPEARRSRGPPVRAPQPARPQLRDRGLPRRGRGQQHRLRRPGQRPRRVPPQPHLALTLRPVGEVWRWSERSERRRSTLTPAGGSRYLGR